jgi:Phosphomannomutase
MADEAILEAVRNEEGLLGDEGRILVRESGTEALIRVMVEAKLDRTAEDTAKILSNFIKIRLNEGVC